MAIIPDNADDDLPLASCLMPTHNRRQFVPKAIEFFLRQDYAHRELIIVDDGTDAIEDLVPDDARLRYFRQGRKSTIGAKRNFACAQARGEILVHWDDDDWMAERRLSYQIQNLLKEKADLCGLEQLLFYEPGTGRAWQYTYSPRGAPWLAGGTLCYTKSFWRSNPFAEVNVGEDTRFVWSRRAKKMLALPDHTFYVALIHARNTSAKSTRDKRWQPFSTENIRRLLGEDWNFYAARWPEGRKRESNHNPETRKVKLNLGCCDAPLPGYLNVDLVAGAGVEVADLRQPWPWPESSVEFVRAWDIIEHLPDKIFTMNELWRVLKPGGRAEIAVPTTEGTGAWQDPTHVSFWNRRSFLYYEAGNPYRERFARHYGIRAKFRTISERTEPSPDGPRLTIVLAAVKP